MRALAFKGSLLLLSIIAALLTASQPRSGEAAFPGVNGKIAFSSNRDGPAFNYEIYTMNPDGSGQTNLTNNPDAKDWRPAWSPDGSKIAFDSQAGGYDRIYVMDADGGNLTQLTSPPPNVLQHDSNPAWSPDGSRISFDRYHKIGDPDIYTVDIYVMNADGSGQTQLTTDPVIAYDPAWSPDGGKIAFNSGRDDPSALDIFIMNADGSGQTNLTSSPGVYDAGPEWSPDGSKIAFSSGGFEIYTMNPDGSGQTNLTNNAATDFSPAWSPDGGKIVFDSDRDGNQEIYVMNADGSNPIRLTNNPAADYSPSWQPVPPQRMDANCNGIVDAPDALNVQMWIAGLPANACVALAGNADCLGGIVVLDALYILRDVAGYNDPLCIV